MSQTDPPSSSGSELSELFAQHADGLAGAARGILGPGQDTQEILQETYLRAFEALQKGFVPEQRVGWLFVITMNLCRDQRRKRQRRGPSQPIDEVDAMHLQSTEHSPARGAEQQETLQAARAAIHQLREPEREVFLLRTSAGLSFEQAAETLRIPVGTAKTRMRAALIKLRHSLRAFAPENFETGEEPGRQAR